MAAPTNAALVKILLANAEPSTHGPSRHFAMTEQFGRYQEDCVAKLDWLLGLSRCFEFWSGNGALH